jgi:aspartate aminotransferase-like enzyme
MTPTTPPLPLLFALDAALELMIDEGVENVWARHESLGRYARQRVCKLNLDLLSDPAFASNTVTAIRVPTGLSARTIIDHMVARYRVMLQAGQGPITDQTLRVGHMGWVTEADLVQAFDALGASLAELAS